MAKEWGHEAPSNEELAARQTWRDQAVADWRAKYPNGLIDYQRSVSPTIRPGDPGYNPGMETGEGGGYANPLYYNPQIMTPWGVAIDPLADYQTNSGAGLQTTITYVPDKPYERSIASSIISGVGSVAVALTPMFIAMAGAAVAAEYAAAEYAASVYAVPAASGATASGATAGGGSGIVANIAQQGFWGGLKTAAIEGAKELTISDAIGMGLTAAVGIDMLSGGSDTPQSTGGGGDYSGSEYEPMDYSAITDALNKLASTEYSPIVPETVDRSLELPQSLRSRTPAEIDAANALRRSQSETFKEARLGEETSQINLLGARDVSYASRLKDPTTASERLIGTPSTYGGLR